jgi:hypothetical protein
LLMIFNGQKIELTWVKKQISPLKENPE